jgi:hypothetical protein
MEDLQVDMTLFWMVGKAGRDAVVASDLKAVGADLEKSESIVEIDGDTHYLLLTTALQYLLVCLFHST